MTIKINRAKHFTSTDEIETKFIGGKNFYDFNIVSDLYLIDDVKIEFYNKSSMLTGKKKKMFHFWFHTSFVDKSGILTLSKNEIDKADRDKKCKVFDKDFGLELYYDIVDKYVISDWTTPEKKYTYQENFILKKARKLPKIYKQLEI